MFIWCFSPQAMFRQFEIEDNPKPLGIPTVIDRVIQQAIAQVLRQIYDSQFSDNSFGFRPNRSAHDAMERTLEYYLR